MIQPALDNKNCMLRKSNILSVREAGRR